MALLTLKREHYTAQSTSGQLYDQNGEHLCYTLEDTVRALGIKVNGETAIPGGTPEEPMRYKITVTPSARFKREMVIISNTDENWLIKVGNVEFRGARLHGGNKHKDSHGCPLCAYNRIDWDTIQGTAEKEVTALVKELEKSRDVYLDVINLPQNG